MQELFEVFAEEVSGVNGFAFFDLSGFYGDDESRASSDILAAFCDEALVVSAWHLFTDSIVAHSLKDGVMGLSFKDITHVSDGGALDSHAGSLCSLAAWVSSLYSSPGTSSVSLSQSASTR